MKEIKRTMIPIKSGYEVRSLCWHGDELVDWTSTVSYQMEGTSSDPTVSYGYRFDQAACSASGEYVVLYEQLGTKGLILKRGEVVREINRSFYHADVYEYPVVLFTLPNGVEAIAHCPDHYNVIEIEEVESGKRLTSRSGEANDFFHSRLGDVAVSFYESPRLLDLATGKVLHRWPEFATGLQNSSSIHHIDRVPPLALDPLNRRFAIADPTTITVVQLG